MAKRRNRPNGERRDDDAAPTGTVYPPAERELVLVAEPDAWLRVGDDGISPLAGAETAANPKSLHDIRACFEVCARLPPAQRPQA